MTRQAFLGGLLSLFALTGCTVPLAPAAPEAPPVTVRLAAGGFSVQAVRSAYTLASVHHVDLKVYRAGALVSTTSVASDRLTGPLTLSNLRMATSYEVRAEAYLDAAGTQLISDPTVSRATLTTPALVMAAGVATVDSTPQALSLPLRLIDQTFAGTAGFSVNIVSKFTGTSALNTVTIRLVRVNGTRETALASTTYALAAINAQQVYTVSNLKRGTTYKLYADGYSKNGTRRSAPARSSVSFTTPAAGADPVDDALTEQVIPLSK